MNNIIKCIKLTKFYKDGDLTINILKEISFQLNNKEIVAIIGKSGSGKSTFLHLLAGLDAASSGDVFLNGISINSMSSNKIAQFRNKQLGFIYQFHYLMLEFNILENVAIPLLISNKSKSESEEIAYQMLKKVKLEKKINKYPSEISGGERQRVAIARAFVNKPSLIIADEPTGNLDQYNANIILNLIFEFNSSYDTSFLIVTHDVNLIKKIPVLFEMKNGQLYNYNNQ
ncbi:lipoprotein ABC transporter ATP-binding protein [Buchnera aphidicola (Diuraphis noxia)]|uniref:Lipoprotein-releasing system ATP-binding protein LolD n=1 Tax=Buchnera aphidicola subsp. Diuraphis noxia TaxID=118101 RepID=A0A1B2H900_BUCDN|nr:lipoprotein-releasing ABC transporter ATP-binding protein LolD [Buchnera aphidicola]ANZ22509.1 lipoprotein ABC transporter ATP-binding protein [Buchnera aphidicola (Diuraphis noxia)]